MTEKKGRALGKTFRNVGGMEFPGRKLAIGITSTVRLPSVRPGRSISFRTNDMMNLDQELNWEVCDHHGLVANERLPHQRTMVSSGSLR